MEYTLKYSNKKNIEAINHVRLYKRMILPCELVGFLGMNLTKEFRD